MKSKYKKYTKLYMKYLTIRSYRYGQTPFRIQLSWGGGKVKQTEHGAVDYESKETVKGF